MCWARIVSDRVKVLTDELVMDEQCTVSSALAVHFSCLIVPTSRLEMHNAFRNGSYLCLLFYFVNHTYT